MDTRTARIIRARRKRRQLKRGDARYLVRGLGVSFTLLITLIFLGVFGVVGTMAGTYIYYARELPPPSQIETIQAEAFQTTILYDRTGQQVIYEAIPPLGGDRKNAAIQDIPPYFLDATVAIEDASFYTNPGFDIRGISRALWNNMTGGVIQGGSTITQQLVKNVLLPEDERTTLSVDRKIKEIILASEISRLYSKDQILEWYVNTNFYGNLAYGIEAASQVYFNKPARELTLAEAALLAAIPQYPLQNPIDDPAAAQFRQGLVLNRMVEYGYITQQQANEALAQQIIIRPTYERFNITAPHFSLYARDEARSILNQMGLDGNYLIAQGGLKIYTTLDVDLQEQLECVSRTHVTRLDGAALDYVQNTTSGQPCNAAAYLPALPPEMQGVERDVTNAAGVVLKAETGEIQAMLGSVDYWDQGIDGNFNVAIAERQPGSVFKPIVYITAFLTPLDRSTIITAATMTSDVQRTFTNIGGEPYTPRNIDGLYHGPVSVREALANSYNVPVVEVINAIGLSPVITIAHQLGINSLNDGLSAYGLSLALGAGEVNLVDITYTYNVFNLLGYNVGTPVHVSQARQGYRQLNPTAILRIEDSKGNVLWEYSPVKGTFDRRLVLEPGIAYIMTDILADNEARLDAFGASNPLELSRPAAAKTGTTDNNRDSWTVGYTPQYTTGIWVGNNDNRSMNDVTGSTGAAPIWHAVMEYIHARDSVPITTWQRPNTVVEQTVCKWSGLLPTQNCQQVPGELFYVDPVKGADFRPQRPDDLWYRRSIDTCNNTLANETTLPQCLEERIFFKFPPELTEWAQANYPEMLPPEEEGLVSSPSVFSPVAIVSPYLLDEVGGVVEVLGNTDLENLAYYQLDYGQGNEPSTFTRIGENGTERARSHVLATWDTTNLDDGIYTLRLQVVQEDNRVETVSTPVTVDNTPPEIRLTEPQQAATYSAQEDVFLNLTAEVFDAGDIQRVEFYIDTLPDEATGETDESTSDDGVLIGNSTEFPYTARWTIEGSGLRTFWAVVYDRAGNRTISERIIANLVDTAER